MRSLDNYLKRYAIMLSGTNDMKELLNLAKKDERIKNLLILYSIKSKTSYRQITRLSKFDLFANDILSKANIFLYAYKPMQNGTEEIIKSIKTDLGCLIKPQVINISIGNNLADVEKLVKNFVVDRKLRALGGRVKKRFLTVKKEIDRNKLVVPIN